jgi:hypothetical protein
MDPSLRWDDYAGLIALQERLEGVEAHVLVQVLKNSNVAIRNVGTRMPPDQSR